MKIKIIQEFNEFALKGSALDLAVGVVIGGAFGKIVTSLVDYIIMPLIGLVLGGLDFSGLSIKVGNAVIRYGAFIQSIIDFLLIAFCIFLVIKGVNAMRRKIVPEPEKQPEPDKSEKYLKQIRDLLEQQNKKA